MRRAFLLFYIIVLPVLAFAQHDEAAITKMLAAQVTEWNKGNIAGYMKGYWNSDSLLFIGSKGPRYGYATTLARYKEAYPDAAHMGTLTTTITSLSRLSPEYYFAVGTWHLDRTAGNVGGSFTLLIRRVHGEWVIVCDHSS